MRRFAVTAAAVLAAAGRLLAQGAAAGDMLEALNVERARMDLEPLTLSPALARLAQARAEELTAGEVLDFEPASSADLFRAARDLGYDGPLVQELTSIADGYSCDVVAGWNDALGLADAYRRPEVRDVGLGYGVLGESPLTVLVVGAPVSHDSWRKRWPGTVPREWLTADLLGEIDRKRVGMGVPSFVADEERTLEAQRLADEILADGAPFGRGRKDVLQGTLLYFRAGKMFGPYWREALKIWLAQDHAVLARPGALPAGAGLASRGRGGAIEAVWAVLVGRSP